MNKIDLTPFIQAVIIFVTTAITTFIIPFIKSKTTLNQQKQIEMWVDIAVHAAEQIFNESNQGENKKRYVIDFLEGKRYKLDVDAIDALIESTVNKIKNGK